MEGMVGCWQLIENMPACNLPQDVATGFGKVFSSLKGCEYTPVLYGAKQLVNGINHMIICKQKMLDRDRTENLVQVYLYQTFRSEEEIIGEFYLITIKEIPLGI